MNNDTNKKKSVKVEQKIIEKIKSSTNILVALSRNPTVDALTSALGLTILLDKLGKHATTVFSGEIPVAINFLEPEKTFENTVDSLRDFIISLDKEKADRLRLKTEGDFVKVLITPYKTTISQEDLKFEEGEFNVEFILAIGVKNSTELDRAIAAHGRIFHNAIVATINLDSDNDNLGNFTWQNTESSATFSEMSLNLAKMIESETRKPLIDEQIATAFLTGLVAATDQFRNQKTTPNVMKIAAELMAKGANQQLISSELAAAEINLTEPIGEKIDETDNEVKAAKNDDIAIGHDPEISKIESELENKNNESAVSIREKVENENEKIAAINSNAARMTAESQTIEQTINSDATAAAEAELEKIAQTTNDHNNNLEELKNSIQQENNQQAIKDNSTNPENPQQDPPTENNSTDNLPPPPMSVDQNLVNNLLNENSNNTPEFSHGTPYIDSPTTPPINSALLNDEPASVDPFAQPPTKPISPNILDNNSGQEFNAKANNNPPNSSNNLPPAPELPLPPLGQMPMINSAPNNQAQTTDLPPVPPITNPNSTDNLASQAAALAESAQKIAENTQNPTSFANNSADMSNPAINSGNGEISQNPKPEEKPEPNFPEATTPPSNPNDPTQFHIPGQN